MIYQNVLFGLKQRRDTIIIDFTSRYDKYAEGDWLISEQNTNGYYENGRQYTQNQIPHIIPDSNRVTDRTTKQ